MALQRVSWPAVTSRTRSLCASVAILGLTGCTGSFDRPAGPVGGSCAAQGPYAVEVAMRRLTPDQYAHSVRDIFEGHLTPSAMFPTQVGSSVTGFSNEPVLNSVDELAAERIMLAAEDAAVQIPAALPSLLTCGPDAACARSFIERVGRRAFRRDLLSDELALLTGIQEGALADGASFDESLAMVVAVILQSPQFLYLAEIGTSEADVRALTQHEIATRLSFLFWDSIPDDALLAAADAGELGDPDAIAVQARRLLDDPRAEDGLRRFFREWVHVSNLTATDREAGLSDAEVASMGEAFGLFVTGMVRDGHTLGELLTTSRAPVNAELASLLGVSPPAGEGFTWMELDPERSVGLVTQPLVMASLAHYSESSYVFRGRFVVTGLLCRNLGRPPATALSRAESIQSGLGPTVTRRAVSEAINAVTPCVNCHATLDPPGLAFEHYDAVGAWREMDAHGNAIDTSGTLTGGDGFAGPRELMESISGSREVEGCFDQQWFRFFAARRNAEPDSCALRQVGSLHRETDGSLTEVMVALTRSDAFTHRRIEANGGTEP